MKTFIKTFMSLLSVFTIIVLMYQGDYEHKNTFLNGERNTTAYKINISLYSDNQYVYEVLQKALTKYKGDLFLNYYDSENDTYYKYIYLSKKDYFENIVLKDGRYINLEEMNKDVLLTTQNENIPNKVGTLLDYGNNDHMVIKTLHSMLQDGLFISGNIILNFESDENFKGFISELIEQNIKVSVRDVEMDLEATFPLEIIIVLGYFILALLIYFQVHGSKEKYATKKLLGYSNRTIWFEDIKEFVIWYGCVTIPIQLAMSLIVFREINIFFIKAVIQLLLIGLLQLLVIVLIIWIAHIQLKSSNFIHTLKKKNDSIKSMIINRIAKSILLLFLINLIVLAGENFKTIYYTYSSSMKNWISVKDYVVLPKIEGIKHDYLISSDFRNKQVELYKLFNKNGSIYAEFHEYDSLYRPEKWTTEDILSTYCTVNPNYLLMNKLYDENNNLITVKESDEDYILIVPEKYKPLESEILSNHNRYKSGSISAENRDQKIKIIWSKNNQSIFSYNWDVNATSGNMVEDPIVKVLTESNGEVTDYDRILGYRGNPFKIKIEGNDAYDYIYTSLSQYQLEQYVPQYYRMYDYIAPEIKSKQNLMIYYMVGITLSCLIIIVLIYQNIRIFFQVNKRKIVIQKLTGHGLFSKYHSFIVYYLLEWGIVIAILINTTAKELLWVNIIFLMIMELLIYSFCIMKFEKKTIVKFLKGGE